MAPIPVVILLFCCFYMIVDDVEGSTAEDVMADHPPSSSGGIETADLYSFVLAKCGGAGYSSCPGFQLPANVHFTDEGWTALAAEMERVLLGLAGSSSTRT